MKSISSIHTHTHTQTKLTKFNSFVLFCKYTYFTLCCQFASEVIILFSVIYFDIFISSLEVGTKIFIVNLCVNIVKLRDL